MTLFERKNEFNNNNMSLCESNCNFKGYNKSNSKAICDCNIKNDLSYSYNDNNNNDLLIKIANDKSNSNFGLTQCLDAFTSPEQIKSNSGFSTKEGWKKVLSPVILKKTVATSLLEI